MPLFDFICPKNHYTERIVGMSDNKKTTTCSVCGLRAKRVDFGVPAVAQFKGAGFHAVDYGAPTKSTPKAKE